MYSKGCSFIVLFIGDESDDEQSNSPPAAKRLALSSTPDNDDVAGFVGTHISTC